jgi:diguanylate cyclase
MSEQMPAQPSRTPALARAAARLFGLREDIAAPEVRAPEPTDPNAAIAEQLAKLIEEATAKLAEASALIRQSQDEAQNYGEALETSAREAAVPESGPLLEIVLDLTRTMIDRTRDAEIRLRAMGGEMDELRGDLDEARRSADADSLTGLANRRGWRKLRPRRARTRAR